MKSINAFLLSPYSSIKHSTYFDVYDLLFNAFRGKKITFLEVGVLNGGSLFMWREYFGSNARIIGVDLNPLAKRWEDFGFEIFIGDQSDLNFWINLINQVGTVDIVLDDGGHTYLQQIITVKSLIDYINEDGLIVVEDTHTSYMKNFGSKKGKTFIDWVFEIVNGINYRYGDFNQAYEKKIYSVQFFNSMVSFRISSKKSIKSKSISNNNNYLTEPARDFRYGTKNKNFFFDKLISFVKKTKFLYFILKPLYKGLINPIIIYFLNLSRLESNNRLKKQFGTFKFRRN